jgi:uridine kinase
MTEETNIDFKKRKIIVTTKLGVVLLEGETILNNKEILELFDKNKYGIFINDDGFDYRLDIDVDVKAKYINVKTEEFWR